VLAIGDDVGGLGYDEFARARNPPCMADFLVLRKMLYAVEDVQSDAFCGGRIMLGDVRAQGDESWIDSGDHTSIILSEERGALWLSPKSRPIA
jgi:hypothetical protein